MTIRTAFCLVLATALPACSPEAPPETPAPPATAPAALPAAPEAPPGAPTILSPVVYADFESRLESGVGCSLNRDGDALLVVVSGAAVARVAGELVDMAGAPESLNEMVEGGRYTGGGATVDIALAPELGAADTLDYTVTEPVRVTVTRGGQTERFDAEWSCGD